MNMNLCYTYEPLLYLLLWHPKCVIDMKLGQLLFWWSWPQTLLFLCRFNGCKFYPKCREGKKGWESQHFCGAHFECRTRESGASQACIAKFLLHLQAQHSFSINCSGFFSGCFPDFFLLIRTVPYYQLGISSVMFSTSGSDISCREVMFISRH